MALVDGRLYLPKEWTDDRDLCYKAGVPDEVTFKSKSQLALDVIRHASSQGIRFAWVGADGGYGKEPDFLSALDDANEQFLVDVHKDQSIYLEDPAPYIPSRRTSKGRTTSRHITNAPKITVETWTASQPEDAWQRITTRDSSKGRLMEVRHKQRQAAIDSAYARQPRVG